MLSAPMNKAVNLVRFLLPKLLANLDGFHPYDERRIFERSIPIWTREFFDPRTWSNNIVMHSQFADFICCSFVGRLPLSL